MTPHEVEKLMPCPFCGGEAEDIWIETPISWWFIQCSRCLAQTGRYSSVADATRAWNRRAALPQEQQALPDQGECIDWLERFFKARGWIGASAFNPALVMDLGTALEAWLISRLPPSGNSLLGSVGLKEEPINWKRCPCGAEWSQPTPKCLVCGKVFDAAERTAGGSQDG